jgi:hypothetical protein
MSVDIEKPIYCFDSSAFIDSWGRYYHYKFFPTLWDDLLNGLIESGRIIVTKEAQKELIAGADELTDWFKLRASCVVPFDPAQIAVVAEIVTKYPKVSQYHKPRPNHADPFVVALAKCKNAVVVTWEAPNGSTVNPSIPSLCNEFGVKYCDLLGVFESEGWRFKH